MQQVKIFRNFERVGLEVLDIDFPSIESCVRSLVGY